MMLEAMQNFAFWYRSWKGLYRPSRMDAPSPSNSSFVTFLVLSRKALPQLNSSQVTSWVLRSSLDLFRTGIHASLQSTSSQAYIYLTRLMKEDLPVSGGPTMQTTLFLFLPSLRNIVLQKHRRILPWPASFIILAQSTGSISTMCPSQYLFRVTSGFCSMGSS